MLSPVVVNILDSIMTEAQRQGRLSFYMVCNLRLEGEGVAA
jgi:hypothetical protein